MARKIHVEGGSRHSTPQLLGKGLPTEYHHHHHHQPTKSNQNMKCIYRGRFHKHKTHFILIIHYFYRRREEYACTCEAQVMSLWSKKRFTDTCIPHNKRMCDQKRREGSLNKRLLRDCEWDEQDEKEEEKTDMTKQSWSNDQACLLFIFTFPFLEFLLSNKGAMVFSVIVCMKTFDCDDMCAVGTSMLFVLLHMFIGTHAKCRLSVNW